MKKLLFIFMICCCSLSATTAQEREDKERTIPRSEALVQFQLAASLAQYGYSTYSATALLEAAKILSTVATQPLEYKSFEQDGISGDKPQSGDRELTVAQLLADATEYADGDKVVLSLIKRFVPKDNHRGRSEGCGSVSSSINSLSIHTYNIQFDTNEAAEIVLSGNGSTDLDLYVYNEDGSLEVKATDATDVCYVSWHPKSGEAVTVKIKNNGSNNNSYQMITN